MNFSSTHPPAKNKDFNTLIHSASTAAENMWSKDAWLHAGSGKMIIGHMLSFSKWPHERMTISTTVVVFSSTMPPIQMGSMAFDPWAPQIVMWNVGDCRRQQTSINARQTCGFQTKAGGRQGWREGGWQVVTDTDHLTLHPPDGLTRQNNITPWSTGVKQARACHSLTLKHIKSIGREASLLSHGASANTTHRITTERVYCHSSCGCSDWKGNGWPTSHMFVTQFQALTLPWQPCHQQKSSVQIRLILASSASVGWLLVSGVSSLINFRLIHRLFSVLSINALICLYDKG